MRFVHLTLLFVLLVVPSAFAANIVVDHSNFDWYDSQNPDDFNGFSNDTYFFAHASVGGNMVNGLSDLRSSDSTRYFVTSDSDDATPPASPSRGVFYEYNRGNPGWSAKVSDFETYVNNGWRYPNVTVAINKFCYIDQTADWATYRDSMQSLESTYGNTVFVYMTIPIKTDTNSEAGYQRQVFNDSLRNFISGSSSRVLFDIADIEAYSPGGVQQTSSYSGNTYQLLHADYTDDGGHLNGTGRVRVAKGLYTLFGRIHQSPLGAVPTVGEWGMIILVLFMIGAVVFTGFGRRLRAGF